MANEFRVRKKLIVNGSGSTILDVQGSQGQLFSITDSLSGSLFSVKDISGIPVMEAFSDDTVNIGTFNAEAIKVSGSFARITGSLLGTASYAVNGFPYTGSARITGSLNVIGITTLTGSLNVSGSTTQVGNNTLIGNTQLSGSIGVSGSQTFVGDQSLTGSFLVLGSTVQVGNNTLLGNTVLTGSILISSSFQVGSLSSSVQIYGDTEMTGYLKFNPYSTNIDTTISASYIFVSGSTKDLYFSQNGNGYSNVTRLRWLEGNLYTGLLHGGLITTQSSTVYQVSSGSAVIVDMNASLADDPYPTTNFIQWPNLSASIDILSASFDQSFIAVQATGSSGKIYAQGIPYDNGQFNTLVPIGNVIHQNRSSINATATYPSVAYAYKQRSSDFLRAFGALKISGLGTAVSGSSTGSISILPGTAYSEGRNYVVDPNNPSYVIDTGQPISKIFRYYSSGSAFVYQTNGGAGFGSIDPTRYNNNGTLSPVANNKWTLQRVFYFPGGATKGIYVYYGNAIYDSQLEAIANITTEAFTEAPNTAAGAVQSSVLVLQGNANFTNASTFSIRQAGLFRNVGGSGGGGTAATNRLVDLSDVSITSPTSNQPFAYDDTLLKWTNQSAISASLKGNADTATLAATASSADNFTVRGTLTAQTIVAQTITSSTDYVTGSTRFGSLSTDTHQFTGSVSITGSSTLIGPSIVSGSLLTTNVGSGFIIEAKNNSGNSGGFRVVGNNVEVVGLNAVVGFVGGSNNLDLRGYSGGSTGNTTNPAATIANTFNYNASSVNTPILSLSPSINQTGTAGYTLLNLAPTINTTGSGVSYYIRSTNFNVLSTGDIQTSGSTRLGSLSSNTHQFTGSVSITGSLTLPYLSTGSVLFAGATDNIAEDNANLFWDNTNKRLGIGTNVPSYRLDITGNVRVSSGTTTNGLLQFFGVTGGYYHDIQGGDYGSHPDVTRIRLGNSGTHWRGVMSFWTKDENTTIITQRLTINQYGNILIGSTLDFGERLQVTGNARVSQAITSSQALISGSGTQRLVVVGSGSAQPIFTVQGSQGELFSIVDSLSGSLFSVNDQSGLPIMEVFSDSTILMGNYLDPMLLTTTRTGSAAGINTIYSLPTASYDAVYMDYTIRSGSNARAGNFMAMWSGTSVNFTDTSITEFGTTSGFIFGAHISGSNMVVTGSSPTAGWIVKTIIKAI